MSEVYPSHALSNSLPSLTVPDQAMTIPEIIARFTRTGMLPASYLNDEEDGQEASLDTSFDPLDHVPSEFDPKVHQDKLNALQAKSEPSSDPAPDPAPAE